jgi:hypothetical protein
VLRGLVRFMNERGGEAARVTAEAERRKIAEGGARSAPVYFGGADNEEPAADDIVSPPPCGYRLDEAAVAKLGPRLELHGIDLYRPAGGPFVPMGQSAEPVIPLLLDGRGARKVVDGAALNACPVIPGVPSSSGAPRSVSDSGRPRGPALQPKCSSRRTVLLRLTRRRGKSLRTVVTANRRRMRVIARRGIALIRLDRVRGTVRVRIVQKRRFRGRTRTFRATRTLRVCR